MKLLFTYIPFQFLLGVVLGIICVTNVYSIFFLGFVFCFCCLFFFFNFSRDYKQLSLFGLLFCFGVFAAWFSKYLQKDTNQPHHYSHFSATTTNVKFRLEQHLKSSKFYDRYFGNLYQIGDKNACGKILVEVLKDSLKTSNLQLGDVLVCKTKIFPINQPHTPYGFNYKKYLASKQVYGKVRGSNFIKINKKPTFIHQIQKYRYGINNQMAASKLSNQAQDLLRAMLLGDRAHLSKEIQTSFTNAGVVHLIAISGMHVGVLYMLLLSAFGFLQKWNYGKYLYVFFLCMGLWAFAIFSGLSSSVVRCVTMFSFVALSKLKHRKGLLLEPIVTSMLLLLLFQPNYLYDVGFQLSYTAVISIVTFYPLVANRFSTSSKIVTYFADVVWVSLIAQLGVLPITLYYFQQLPLQFLFANFVAVSLLPVVLYGGILILLKVLWIAGFSVVEIWFNFFIKFYTQAIHYFSSLDFLILKNIVWLPIHVVFYYILCFFAWSLLKRFSYQKVIIVGVLCVAMQSFNWYYNYKTYHKRELLIYPDYKKDVITIKTADTLQIIASKKRESLIKQNKLKNRIHTEVYTEVQFFSFKNEIYWILDKNYSYMQLNKNYAYNIIVLGNPLVNMERVLRKIHPKKVIFGTSNYVANVQKWKSTCKKLQVPFYDMKEHGFYRY